jgi:hypothetical protein
LWQPTINKELWQLRLFASINDSTNNLYMDTIVNGWLVNRKVIWRSMIPLIIDGIWTRPIWTFAVWTDANLEDSQYNIDVVVDKWELQVRATSFYVEFSCWDLGAQILLQDLFPKIEMLDQLTTSTN